MLIISSVDWALMATCHIKQYGNIHASAVNTGAKYPLCLVSQRITITVLNIPNLGSIKTF